MLSEQAVCLLSQIKTSFQFKLHFRIGPKPFKLLTLGSQVIELFYLFQNLTITDLERSIHKSFI